MFKYALICVKCTSFNAKELKSTSLPNIFSNTVFELYYLISRMKKIKVNQSDIFNNSDKIVAEVLELCKI